MCLAAFALDAHPRRPFVLAANRDEFHDRPAGPMAWWTPAPHAFPVLSGRDLRAGGTWLGLTREGRLGLLTNVRERTAAPPEAASRGHLVLRWLQDGRSPQGLWDDLEALPLAGFNLLAFDFPAGQAAWMGNRARGPVDLGPGLHGLSNATLDTPWPKVERLKSRLHRRLDADQDSETLALALLADLRDDRVPTDAELPDTGVGLEKERMLGSVFVRSPSGHYGTRCSTVLVTERLAPGAPLRTLAFEQTFGPEGETVGPLRRHLLEGWPATRR